MLAYQRRVSFDSISPEDALRERQIPRIPPQYNDGSSLIHFNNGTKKRNFDLNFGYEPTRKTDVKEVFSSIDRIGNTNYVPQIKRRTKAPKLPPPPSHSILKNNDVQRAVPQIPKLKPRLKSLVGLTDAELVARDAQYRLGVDLQKLRFDGDAYLPTITSNYHEKTRYDSVKKIDMSLADLRAKSKSLTNLNSYSVSYRHQQYSEYIQHRIEEDDIPDSFRNVMLYISGRRHTWTALDWCLENYLRDGDQLIVISQVQEDDEGGDDLKRDISITSNNLKSYIGDHLKSIDSDLKVAFTFDFIKEASMESLIKNAAEFYQPQVFLVSSLLSNLNITFEEGKKRKKLPVYLITLKIPSIIIPEQLIDGSNLFELRIPNFESGKITMEDDNDVNFEKNVNKISDNLDETQDHQPIVTYRTNSTSTGVSHQGSTGEPKPFTPTQVSFDNTLHPTHSGPTNSSSRRISNQSSGSYSIQKVKSMLEFDEPVSASSTTVNRSKSNNPQRQKSNDVIRSKSLDSTDKKRTISIFGSLFGRKKK